MLHRNFINNFQNKLNNYYIILIIFILFFILLLIFYNINKTSQKAEVISPFLTTKANKLYYKGKEYKTVGYNSYNAAFLPTYNVGCGGQINNLDELFSTFRSNGMIRIWAMQGSMAINPTTKQLDWTGIDHVLSLAEKHNQLVILTLGNQSGQCDDNIWKDNFWYTEGYKQINNESGFNPISYWEYVQKIITRYKDSKVIAMWELMNEPETSDCEGYTGHNCYEHQICHDHEISAKNLRSFFDSVGEMVKNIDSNHLIGSGVIGTGQCGSDNDYYTYIHQSPYIDVASYHDYNEDNNPLPGDEWNGLKKRINQMKDIGKPIIVGELGILASHKRDDCTSTEERKNLISSKLTSMFNNDVSAVLLWNKIYKGNKTCSYDIDNKDPLTEYIKLYSLH